MISIIIPLGKGSRWNNLELRYCLRSVEKHLAGYGDVFIVGEKPEWLRNVVHISCPDQGDKTYDKEHNIFCKVLAACADGRVTDNFLFMNDDHFLLQDYEVDQFPYYYQRRLGDFMTVSEYKNTVFNTIKALSPYNPVYADVHCPIVYNKAKFAELTKYDWKAPFGYCIKTLYCHQHVQVFKEYPDLKISEAYPATEIRQLIADRPWFSIGDRAREGELLPVLKELYPHKSSYEH